MSAQLIEEGRARHIADRRREVEAIAAHVRQLLANNVEAKSHAELRREADKTRRHAGEVDPAALAIARDRYTFGRTSLAEKLAAKSASAETIDATRRSASVASDYTKWIIARGTFDTPDLWGRSVVPPPKPPRRAEEVPVAPPPPRQHFGGMPVKESTPEIEPAVTLDDHRARLHSTRQAMAAASALQGAERAPALRSAIHGHADAHLEFARAGVAHFARDAERAQVYADKYAARNMPSDSDRLADVADTCLARASAFRDKAAKTFTALADRATECGVPCADYIAERASAFQRYASRCLSSAADRDINLERSQEQAQARGQSQSRH